MSIKKSPKLILTEQSECEFPISINMAHYKLEQQITEEEVADNSVLEEWFDISEPDEIAKIDIVSQEELRVHADIYKAYKPIDLGIHEYKLNSRGVSEVIRVFSKKYKFPVPPYKFILFDEYSGNLLTGQIVGHTAPMGKFDWLYKSMRETVFIPMMSHCLFNITR